MNLKLVADLSAVASEGSLARAARMRNVTQPAFGRRIRSLEAWAGVPLLERPTTPARLTPAGQELLAQAQPLLDALESSRNRWRRNAVRGAESERLHLGTGRTLARTRVVDWLARVRGALDGASVSVRTSAMAEVASSFERGEVDLLCCYEHPALSLKLSPHRFRFLTLQHDRLVPVSSVLPSGRTRHTFEGSPRLDFGAGLALGRLLQDHLERSSPSGLRAPLVHCDSADALREMVLRGLGYAWLPWSMVAGDCRRGVLGTVGGRASEVHFEVRMYRPRARQRDLVERVWAATER